MSGYLFPRLDTGNAKLWAERFSGMAASEIAGDLPRLDPEGVRYAPTGGEKVPPERIDRLRRDLIELASGLGYPTERSLAAQRTFDLGMAEKLADLELIKGEALRDEVWQYLTCILIPDVVAWRHGKTVEREVTGPASRERFLGGTRNMMQRMWWRAMLFQDRSSGARFWLMDTGAGGLTEDNMVAILERGNIAWYPDLCRTIALQFLQYRPHVDNLGPSPEQRLLREVMKGVVRLAAHANLEAIREEARSTIVSRLFREVVGAMGGEAPQTDGVYSGFITVHIDAAAASASRGGPWSFPSKKRPSNEWGKFQVSAGAR